MRTIESIPAGFVTCPQHYLRDGGEGFSSELAAKIALKKNPEWQSRNPQIVPFVFWDGSMFGKYSKPTKRFAVLLQKAIA